MGRSSFFPPLLGSCSGDFRTSSPEAGTDDSSEGEMDFWPPVRRVRQNKRVKPDQKLLEVRRETL